MTLSVTATRLTRLLAATLVASATLAGCHSDDVVGTNPFVECADQPGCQTEMTPVAQNVIPALETPRRALLQRSVPLRAHR